MNPESKFWANVRNGTPDTFVASRIENTLEAGFPDVIFLHKPTGIVGFLELKAGPRKILRPAQTVFLTRWKRAFCFVAWWDTRNEIGVLSLREHPVLETFNRQNQLFRIIEKILQREHERTNANPGNGTQ